MQLIHWFTNNKKFESQDTVAVLEAIMVKKGGWILMVHIDCDTDVENDWSKNCLMLRMMQAE